MLNNLEDSLKWDYLNIFFQSIYLALLEYSYLLINTSKKYGSIKQIQKKSQNIIKKYSF